MKIVIFAGGTGRRLWPLSRQASPKQFEPILGEKSTLQLAVGRVRDRYGAENIFVSTNKRYQDTIREQLPELPQENIIGEPERRDLAAAVGLAMAHLAQASKDSSEAVAILWGDNYMNDTGTFLELLEAAERLLQENEAKIVFMGETPRFANENLGWIGLGERQGAVQGRPYFAFRSWRYRPPREVAETMFAQGKHVWNTGYFVTRIGFVQSLYRQYQPQMAEALQEIQAAIGSAGYETVLAKRYAALQVASFDDAILTHVGPEEALVLHGEMGWSDPGTLYALKEALAGGSNANVEEGLVMAVDTADSLLLNYEREKLMAVIGLEGFVVVNMEDALLVVSKERIPDVKALVNRLQGTELEKYS
ncbi:MAG TPA: sugar phosphate nucleotidyltransferase [Candidatus Binatia bacterium]|jgi:mannose-1-phosphate guanylyltransferase|nr:sugar phosphate nucleotidyltransferase [Candidatus Binatia bacterium]